MRALFVIPHFFRPDGRGRYGSVRADPQPRIAALSYSLRSLYSLFGRQQLAFQDCDGLGIQVTNQWTAIDLDIILCTTDGAHLIDALPIPEQYFQHRPLDCHAKELGFYCQRVLAENLTEAYDYYCYLEDDLILRDPLFFMKQSWFHGASGERAILQPNRFEIAQGDNLQKVYVDLEFDSRTGRNIGYAHNFTDRTVLNASFLGQSLQFQRAGNPHAGCFFLTRSQMEYWSAQPEFAVPESRFIGLLESAASLHLMKYFRVYKPALDCANFLEIEHWGDRNSQDLLENYKTIRFQSKSTAPTSEPPTAEPMAEPTSPSLA